MAGPRTARMSCVTVLLTDERDGFSALHRLSVDEGWQWLDGDPVRLVRLGSATVTLGGSGPTQAIVDAGTWQGARTTGSWSLLSCWCTPAFADDVFELGDRHQLLERFPGQHDEITALTR